jgi:molybdopterin converting factor small subunit
VEDNRMKLKVFSPLCEKIGFNEKEVKLDGKLCIRDIKELSGVPLDDYVLSINKMKIVKSNEEVSDADELWILPLVEGG